MSKHCEVCNRSYPDDLKACPHCAEVVEIGEADVVDLGSSTQMVVEEAPEIVAGASPVAPSRPARTRPSISVCPPCRPTPTAAGRTPAAREAAFR